MPIWYFLPVWQVTQTLDNNKLLLYLVYPIVRIFPVAKLAPAVNQVNLETRDKFKVSTVPGS